MQWSGGERRGEAKRREEEREEREDFSIVSRFLATIWVLALTSRETHVRTRALPAFPARGRNPSLSSHRKNQEGLAMVKINKADIAAVVVNMEKAGESLSTSRAARSNALQLNSQ